MDWAVLLFVVAALAAGLFAVDRSEALFELRSVILLPALYYALLRLIPLDRGAQQSVVDGLLLGGVAVAAIGLVQGVLGRNLVAAEGGLFRLRSVYHSPNSLGLYLGRVWPFLVVGAWWGRKPRRRAFSILGLVAVTLALGLSFSRGALLLGLPASILVMGLWAGGRHRRVALAALAAWGLALIPLFFLPRFRALFDLGEGTTFFRLKLWRSSLQMLRDHPLFGVGPGSFLSAYRTRYVLPAAWEEFNLGHAHNVVLDHWTRLGVLGVAGGLALQVTFWKVLRRRGRDVLTLSLAGGMAALLAHGLVDNAVFAPDLALTFFLMLALAQGQGGEG
jgi:O-antigen ligase